VLIFEVRGNGAEGRRYRVAERDVTIGREQTNDIVLSTTRASRFHAAIILRDSGEYVLRDLGSRNGTRVNGRECFRHVLEANDEIQIGSQVIVFLGRESTSEADAEERPFFTLRRRRPPASRRSSRDITALDSQSSPRSEGLTSPEGLDIDNDQLLRTLKCAQVITSTRSVPLMLGRLLESVLTTLHAERGFAALCEGGEIRCLAAVPADASLGELVAGKAELVYQAVESRTPVVGGGLICIPIPAGASALGVVGVEGQYDRRPIQGLDLAVALCGLCGLHVENAREYARLKQQCIRLYEAVQSKHRFVGSSPVLDRVYATINQAAQCDLPLLITGETGTGKELIARAVHDLSRRSQGPFVAVNCATTVENLLESEMFGYAPLSGIANANPKGKPGKFELADGGTIFLDEVGDFPLHMQAKLLRVLEDSMVERIGAEKPTRVNLRVIAATNRNLQKMVAEGRFREDLYFRLNCLQVTLPPLRERASDILLLAAYFLEHPPTGLENTSKIRITRDVAQFLLSHPLPGNVRQLRNSIWRAASFATGGKLDLRDFPSDMTDAASPASVAKPLRQVEREHIQRALETTGGNKRKAAQMLGISHQTLYTKMKDYGITAGSHTADG